MNKIFPGRKAQQLLIFSICAMIFIAFYVRWVLPEYEILRIKAYSIDMSEIAMRTHNASALEQEGDF